jgi:hypothetical protein
MLMSPLGDEILINVLCFVTAPHFCGAFVLPYCHPELRSTVILNEVKDLNKNYKTLTI